MEPSDSVGEDGNSKLGVSGHERTVTTDYSLSDQEKDSLFEKTKTQESQIVALRLKVESYERQRMELEKLEVWSTEEKASMEREINTLRGKVALLERNNKIFSNQERTELKQELERTKRRFKNLNEQLTSIRNSMEYDHVNHVERALENFVKKVKMLEKENHDLRIRRHRTGTEEGESSKLYQEQEEIIKDKDVLIEELKHRMNEIMKDEQFTASVSLDASNEMKSSTSADRTLRRSASSHRPSQHGSRSRMLDISPRGFRGSSTSTTSKDGSDSDARAVREMCGKMRKDIEQAKKKLKDMGIALEIPQHLSTMHFPMRVFMTPTMEADKDVKVLPGSAGNDVILEHGTRPTREKRLAVSDAGVSWMSKPTGKLKIHRSWTGSVPLTRREDSSCNLDMCEDDELNFPVQVLPRQDELVHLISRYEFLRVKALDLHLLEQEHECTREDYLGFVRLNQRSKDFSKRTDKRSNVSRDYHTRADDAVYRNGEESNRVSNCVTPVLKDLKRQASANITSKDYGLRSSRYRVYMASSDYDSSSSKSLHLQADGFPSICLRVGDIVTSLGAPETQRDGQQYQLVQVNHNIGFVPYSHLQLIKVFDEGRDRLITRAYLTSMLRRIPDMFKRLLDRRQTIRNFATDIA